nr:uracil-DNA glycosylase family protein [Allorhizobium sonneratiae]
MKSPLDVLTTEIAACHLCRDKTETPLPHAPRPVVVLSSTAKILIAGQAPGKRVHETGLAFNDASGDRLRDWLGVDRARFYDPGRFAILPMGFCFPGYDAKGHDLPPRRECAPHWRGRALAVMPQIRLVVLVGAYAQTWHLGRARQKTMTDTVKHFRDYEGSEDEVAFIPLPHPSWRNSGWLKRNPWFEAELLPHLKKKVDHFAP